MNSRHRIGLARYLKTGQKKGEKLSREERDHVTPLIGSLDLLYQNEMYMAKHLNYAKGNYIHSIISFSKKDEQMIRKMTEQEREKFYQEILQKFNEFYLSGYTPEEIVQYAELHTPKVKKGKTGKVSYIVRKENENGQYLTERVKFLKLQEERFEHIHIGSHLYSPELQKKIKFREHKPEVEDAFCRYLCEKYGLEYAQQNTPKRAGYRPRPITKLTGKALEKYIEDICEKRAFSNNVRKNRGRRKLEQKAEKNMSKTDEISIENIKIEPLDDTISPRPKEQRDDRNLAQKAAKATPSAEFWSKIRSLNIDDVVEYVLEKNFAKPGKISCVEGANKKGEIVKKIRHLDEKNIKIFEGSMTDWLWKFCDLEEKDMKKMYDDLQEKQIARKNNEIANEKPKPELVFSLQTQKQYEKDQVMGFEKVSTEFLVELAEAFKKFPYSSSIFRPLRSDEILKKRMKKAEEIELRNSQIAQGLLPQSAQIKMPYYLENPTTIAAMKKYDYRSSDTVQQFSNVQIFDVDNPIVQRFSQKPYTWEKACDTLEKSGYAGFILTTRSHQKADKFEKLDRQIIRAATGDLFEQDPQAATTQTIQKLHTMNISTFSHEEVIEKFGADKADGKPDTIYIQNQTDRLRFVVVGEQPFTIPAGVDIRKGYDAVREQIAKTFGIEDYVDQATKSDVARFYYPSGTNAALFISSGQKTFDMADLAKKAAEIVAEKQAEKQEARLAKAQSTAPAGTTAIRQNRGIAFQSQYGLYGEQMPYFTIADMDALRQVPFASFLAALNLSPRARPDKGVDVYSCADGGLYGYFEHQQTGNPSVHDFRDASSQKSYDYVGFCAKFLGPNMIQNMKTLAQKLGFQAQKFLKKNSVRMRSAVIQALKSPISEKSDFESAISSFFGNKRVEATRNAIVKDAYTKFEYQADLKLDPDDIYAIQDIVAGRNRQTGSSVFARIFDEKEKTTEVQNNQVDFDDIDDDDEVDHDMNDPSR